MAFLIVFSYNNSFWIYIFRIVLYYPNGDLNIFLLCEWDENAQKTYKANFHDDFAIAGDITKIDETDVPKFDICLAGFPCQAFSLAGQRMGFEDNYKGMCRGTLFMDVARICEYHMYPHPAFADVNMRAKKEDRAKRMGITMGGM